MIGKGLFQYGTWDSPERVSAAGGQVMNSLGLVKDIPVVILDRPMPIDPVSYTHLTLPTILLV